MSQLCRLFGLSRQAWYAAARYSEKHCFQEDVVLQEVRRLRGEIPGLGTAKLYEMMQPFLHKHTIKIGRDKLHNLLNEKNMLVSKKSRRVTTTDSEHPFYQYPNRAKDIKPGRANELWPGRRCGE